MTGRARGRSRGRARPPGEGGARPGDVPEQAPSAFAGPGRGRSRGAPPTRPPQAGSGGAQAQQVERMQVEEQQQRRPRGVISDDISTMPTTCTSKCGTSGCAIDLVSNYFKLQSLPNFTSLFQYTVEFSPSVDSRGLRNFLLYQHSDVIGRVRVFDGMILFLPIKLPESPMKFVSRGDKIETPVELTVTLTNEWALGTPPFMQLLNIIMRRILKTMEMQQLGRNYYSEDRHIDLKQHNLQLWPGYSTSICDFDGGTMLCLDVSHKVLRMNTVLDTLYNMFNSDQYNFHDKAIKKIVGEIVMTRYNNKTYRIDDIAWGKKPTDTFQLASGEITFVEYYQKNYKKEIRDLEQPLLVSNPKKRDRRRGDTGPILLLPELCVLTGLSDEIRTDFRVMKDLAAHTRMGPDGRARELNGFRNTLKRNEEAKQFLQHWNIDFEDSLIRLRGRVLPAEVVSQQDKRYTVNAEADWSKDLRGAKCVSTVKLNNWVIIHTQRDVGIANDFLQTIERVCGPMGITVSTPRMIRINDDKTESYLRALRSEVSSSTQLVTCILSNNRKDRYDAIKKYTCVDNPVPSQCVVSRTLGKRQMLMSVCTKIGIQLNCKLGGEIWALDIPIKNCMVVGVDVYHDSLTRGKSIGGFVASLNRYCTKYFSRCTQQQSGLEFVDGLRFCMAAALRRYNEENGCLPDKIFVYRDGVGDGQLQMVYEHEMPQLLEAIKGAHQGYNPKFTMIVVKKRISTRLFYNNNGNLGNPPPGTVADAEITRKKWYDFFLVSQSVRQGTVSPTHYNVISDTSGLKPDHIQRLTYKLCHLYYNWPGTIRVPAPCQYAHKLAFLVGQSVHAEPNIALADRLYYL